MSSEKKSRIGLTVSLLIAIMLLLFSFPVSWLADYNSHRNQFSHAVKSYDRDEAQKGLEILKEDYRHFVKWKLGYFADRFLFNKMYQYEAGVSVLNEDYEKVGKVDLKNHEDWEASYILAVSKFWALHAAYQEAMLKKNRATMKKILGIVLEDVRADFEKCVKEGPGPDKNFNCSFDYDMTSDPYSAVRALANPKPQIKYILGTEGDNPGQGKEPAKKGSPKTGPSDNKSPGQGKARKVG